MARYERGTSARAQIEAGQEIATTASISDGEKAEEELLTAHAPLVKAMARRFYSSNLGHVELEDLVAAGTEGLVLALRRFDSKRRVRFSTYALWWVRNRINLFVKHERWVMKIPDRIHRAVLMLLRSTRQLRIHLHRAPALNELAKRLDISVDETLNLLIWVPRQIVSLDIPVGDQKVSTLADFIPSEWPICTTDPDDRPAGGELAIAVQDVLRTLSARERQVLGQRFGLDCDGDASLDVKGRGIAISKERVRELEARALRKLRHTKRAHTLRALWTRSKRSGRTEIS